MYWNDKDITDKKKLVLWGLWIMHRILEPFQRILDSSNWRSAEVLFLFLVCSFLLCAEDCCGSWTFASVVACILLSFWYEINIPPTKTYESVAVSFLSLFIRKLLDPLSSFKPVDHSWSLVCWNLKPFTGSPFSVSYTLDIVPINYMLVAFLS